jgi:hypothetical protein
MAVAFGCALIRLQAATFVVTTTADSGPGSLRKAIDDANATVTRDEIDFNIAPPGVHPILPLTPLPMITNPVIINGLSQSGTSSGPRIQIDGTSAGPGNGLTISTTNCVVVALSITLFRASADMRTGNGIYLNLGGFHTILGNYIGVKPIGSGSGNGNGHDGIYVDGSQNNVIGGSAVAFRDVISGNGPLSQRLAGTLAPPGKSSLSHSLTPNQQKPLALGAQRSVSSQSSSDTCKLSSQGRTRLSSALARTCGSSAQQA